MSKDTMKTLHKKTTTIVLCLLENLKLSRTDVEHMYEINVKKKIFLFLKRGKICTLFWYNEEEKIKTTKIIRKGNLVEGF